MVLWLSLKYKFWVLLPLTAGPSPAAVVAVKVEENWKSEVSLNKVGLKSSPFRIWLLVVSLSSDQPRLWSFKMSYFYVLTSRDSVRDSKRFMTQSSTGFTQFSPTTFCQTPWNFSTVADGVVCVPCAGDRGQHLRGGVGHHQTGHVVWDQRVTSSATSPHLQSHKVSLSFTNSSHEWTHETTVTRIVVTHWGCGADMKKGFWCFNLEVFGGSKQFLVLTLGHFFNAPFRRTLIGLEHIGLFVLCSSGRC